MAVVDTTLSVTGKGDIGDVETWSVTEAATPFVVGDPAASGGSISAQTKASQNPDADPRFALGQAATLTTVHDETPDLISGKVQDVSSSGSGSSVSLTIDTVLSRLSASRVAEPVWADKVNAVFTERGPAPGQIGDPQGIAVDPVNEIVYITSFMWSGGLPLSRVSKFDLDFNFIGEWGQYGTGDGDLGTSGMRIMVHPDDGMVYVTTWKSGLTLIKFNPSGVYQWHSGVGDFFSLAPLVGTGGEFLAGIQGGTVSSLYRMGSGGTFLDSVFLPGPRIIPTSIAIHPTTGLIYVGTTVTNKADGSPSVLIYDSSLTQVGQISYSSIHGRVA